MRRFLSVLMLGAALLAPVAMKADDHRHRYYDPYRRDYHEWNENEERAYRHWVENERRHAYRQWNRASRADQRAYWRWRHEHMDWR